MKYLVLVLLFSFIGCQDKHTGQTKEKDGYFFALYYRYIADSQESKVEFISTKGKSITDNKPHSLQADVNFNNIRLETPRSNNRLSTYSKRQRDEFPQNIELKIDGILDFSTPTPLFRDFIAKETNGVVTINAKTPIAQNEKLLLVLIDRNGKTWKHNLAGPVKYPYQFSITAQALQPPVAVSAVFQQKFTHHKKGVQLSVLLEYYAPEIELLVVQKPGD